MVASGWWILRQRGKEGNWDPGPGRRVLLGAPWHTLFTSPFLQPWSHKETVFVPVSDGHEQTCALHGSTIDFCVIPETLNRNQTGTPGPTVTYFRVPPGLGLPGQLEITLGKFYYHWQVPHPHPRRHAQRLLRRQIHVQAWFPGPHSRWMWGKLTCLTAQVHLEYVFQDVLVYVWTL